MTGTMRREADAARLSVTLLPAGQGDSVLIEYGDAGDPRRILIDGGPARSYGGISAQFARIQPHLRRLDLLVLTHVDADHIEGVIKLLNDADLAVKIAEVWFNGYQQLPPDEYLGPP
jgi:beta-lactamase superfamily II metal-dependent hydrolase